ATVVAEEELTLQLVNVCASAIDVSPAGVALGIQAIPLGEVQARLGAIDRPAALGPCGFGVEFTAANRADSQKSPSHVHVTTPGRAVPAAAPVQRGLTDLELRAAVETVHARHGSLPPMKRSLVEVLTTRDPITRRTRRLELPTPT